MLKDLIIVGAGGFGRELLQWVKDINRIEKKWNVLGFIDDTVEPLKSKNCDYQVIGKIIDWEPEDNQEFAIAIGDPAGKKKVVQRLKEKGAQFATIIHPTANINEFAKIGEGVVIYPHAIIGPDVDIGDFVTLLTLSSVGHDVSLGEYSVISGYCVVAGYVKMGKSVYVATSATIIPHRKIGDDAHIGAGSVVIRNVKAGKHVFGNPAQELDFF